MVLSFIMFIGLDVRTSLIVTGSYGFRIIRLKSINANGIITASIKSTRETLCQPSRENEQVIHFFA